MATKTTTVTTAAATAEAKHSQNIIKKFFK